MSRLAGHIGAALVAYVAASVVAGFSYTFLLAAAIQLTGSIAEPSEMTALAQFQSLVWFAVLATLVIAAVAFLPSLPVIVVLMLAKRTDIFSYIVAGVAIGVSAVMIARRNIIFMDKLEVDWLIVTTGIIAGAVFWAISRKLAPWPARAS